MLNLTRRTLFLVFATLAASALMQPSVAQAGGGEKVNTVMTVGEMCGGCVKKITKRFDTVKGVGKVKCDIAKKLVTVVPAKDVTLSPKAIWEIMEAIGKKPVKMVCPKGTFTSKPKT